jgi:glycosyltransferase involved in cell wall biosynthesis/Flp pilus assembly protein TadD
LGALETADPVTDWSPAFLPGRGQTFRYLWEKAAWINAGRPAQERDAKSGLLRWRLHTILAEATGELNHYFEAALAAPEMAGALGALGCALARNGQPLLALSHLRKAVALDPFDLQARRALFHALGDVEQPSAQRRVEDELDSWHRAAPQFFPDKAWLRPLTALPAQFDVVSSPFRTSLPAPESALRRPAGEVPAKSVSRGVSLCMIVRNEEKNLPECLGSAYDLVDEVIVVDTGSSDKTKEIAEQFGAQVFDFPWCDDFAAARNESLRHATREWIFWMDADDRLDHDNRLKLRELFKSLPDENVGFVMKCLCLPDQTHGIATEVDHVRLFRNLPNIRWRYRVHEQILLGIRQSGGEIRWSDVAVHHTGYQDPSRRQPKLQRDLRLLTLDHAATPGEPFILFNLGWTYFELQQFKDAIHYLEDSLAQSAPGDSIVRKIFALLVQSHRNLNQPDNALSRCREGRLLFPEDVELLFHEGLLLFQKGDMGGAETCFLQLLSDRPRGYFASVDPALCSYLARYHLGEISLRTARSREAENWWRAVLDERPEFVPAALGLADIFLAERRQEDLDSLLEGLSSDPRAGIDVLVLRGRGYLQRQEHAQAVDLFRAAVAQDKSAFGPRYWLAQALFELGQLPEAEQMLQEALVIRPGHGPALNLLAQIRNQITHA